MKLCQLCPSNCFFQTPGSELHILEWCYLGRCGILAALEGFKSSPSQKSQVIPWLDVFGGKFGDIPTISKGREILELDVTSKFALNACFIVDSDDMKLFWGQFSSPVDWVSSFDMNSKPFEPSFLATWDGPRQGLVESCCTVSFVKCVTVMRSDATETRWSWRN